VSHVRTPVSRRSLLKSGASLLGLEALGARAPLALLGGPAPTPGPVPATRPRGRRRPHVAVIGAGAFGGWTALHLLRKRARVTLLDAWGPGNSRASSGGETRVIRATYGPDRIYVQLVARSLALWRENEKRWQRPLYHKTGVLWMSGDDDRFERASLPLLREAGVAVEEMSAAEAGRRYPQINFERVRRAHLEKDAGYLLARRACRAVLDGFLSEGGTYRQAAVAPGAIRDGEIDGLVLSDGSRMGADLYVFACGPWLSKLFPDAIGERIQPTRQEVYFFGTPPGDTRFLETSLPVWIDHGRSIFYGVPGNEDRGFKVGDDTHGPSFDPTMGDRVPGAEGIRSAREYVAFRFPELKDAPLLEARVCQYENTPDSRFIIDRHPAAQNVWIVGGGSGHGFKHGPAVGEMVADLALGSKAPDPFFALGRFAS
jgi:monomeric sarcosine oxidase